MSEIIRIGGKEHEVVEWNCIDPPGSWNEGIGDWTVCAKPMEQPSEKELARRRVKAFLEARPKVARGIKQDVIHTMNTGDASYELLRADLELLVGEEE